MPMNVCLKTLSWFNILLRKSKRILKQPIRYNAHMLSKTIVSIWNSLIGDKEIFSLEVRIFHCVCILLLLGAFVSAPLNGLLISSLLAWFMLGVFFLLLFIFYLSRYKRKAKQAIILSQIAYYVLLSINYYYNSGSEGPTIVIFILALIFTVITVSKKYYWLWIPLNIGLVLFLFSLESSGIIAIKNSYHDDLSRLADFSYSYLTIAIIVVFVLIYIRDAYNQERKLTAKKTEQLAKSNETKNKLLSIVAHDLKDPLISIQGFLELLTEYDLSATEKDKLEKELLQRTNNAVQMLNNILTWSKSQMEGTKANLIPTLLFNSLSKTLAITKGIATDKGIDLVHNLDNEICVQADPDMLQLIMRNLIINAIKFSHPGGTITINASKTHDTCTISVKDEGVGIPVEKQSEIFSLGKGVTYGTGKEKGAGLGLTLCKNYIEQQGGKIYLTSETGTGTTFFITLNLSSQFSTQTREVTEEI